MHKICQNFLLWKCETGGELGQLFAFSTDQHTAWRCSKEDSSTAAGDPPETETTLERNGSLLAYHRATTAQLAPDDAYECYHCESR